MIRYVARRIIIRPLYANYWISVVHKHWSLCRYSFYATGVTDYVCVMFSVFFDADGYERGPTSRHSVRPEIQKYNRTTFWESFRGAPSCLVI